MGGLEQIGLRNPSKGQIDDKIIFAICYNRIGMGADKDGLQRQEFRNSCDFSTASDSPTR